MLGRRVAVTGVTGFVGGALARRLVADGCRVKALVRGSGRLATFGADIEAVEGDLADAAARERLVDGVDTLFHAAAICQSQASPEAFMRVNVQGTADLLAAARAAGVRRFVHVSSVGVHGHVARPPGDEDSPFAARDPYQTSKLAAERACRRVIEEGGLEVSIVRPCSVYGPGDTRMLKMFKMVAARTFFFVGDGRPNFHPVYVDDVVEGTIRAATEAAAAGETFILGGPRYMPLADYVAAAARTVGAPAPWLRLPYRPFEIAARACEATFLPLGLQPPLHRRRLGFFTENRAFSIDKARRVLGYAPAVDVEEGFRRTVAWYRETGHLPAA